jgi:hypothetical protein
MVESGLNLLPLGSFTQEFKEAEEDPDAKGGSRDRVQSSDENEAREKLSDVASWIE